MSRHRSTPPPPSPQPLLRAAGRAVARLQQALEADGQPAGGQTGLLWAFAMLASRGGQAGRGPVRGGRLSDLCAEIDRACTRSEGVRQAVAELEALCVPGNIERLLQAAPGSAEGDFRWAYLLEALWAASDARRRRRHGGYFTPCEIVRFIVRSVDQLLRDELDLAGGLTCEDPLPAVVDPACGSGAFLLGVAHHVREMCTAAGGAPCWRHMAQDILPGRLAGIDIMPACCGATEILLESLLATRWSAHCGNILDDVDFARTLFAGRLPVILGNPPYANFGRLNRGGWILEQLAAYKTGLGEKKHNLDDDFIKFLRWAQYWIDRAGCGILAMITNNTYLSGLTHRQMRASLAMTFDRIYLLDLHGDARKRERTPAGDADENVFDIQKGVAIGVFLKRRSGRLWAEGRVRHADLWGTRSEKLRQLERIDLAQLPGLPWPLPEPFFFFVPRQDADQDAYLRWPRLDQVFLQHVSGVQTKCDRLFVGFTREEVARRMHACLGDAARGCFAADLPAWLRRRLPGVPFDARHIRPYMVAPWDVRWIYYDPRLLGRARERVMRQLDGQNTALVFMRQATGPEPYDHFLATRVLVSDRVFYSAHGAPFVAPLFVTESDGRSSNLTPSFREELQRRLGVRWNDEPSIAPAGSSVGSVDVFHWLYAVVHSPRYRRRYHRLLSIDFPRIPWPDDLRAFHALARIGEVLADAHCRVASADGPPGPHAVAGGSPDAPARLADKEIRQFRIGGYAVVHRWLQQRRTRTLNEEDQRHLQRVVDTIQTTIRQLPAIDRILRWQEDGPGPWGGCDPHVPRI